MTRDVHAIPRLLDIRSSEFASQYELGLTWALFGEREKTGPLDDSYLVYTSRLLQQAVTLMDNTPQI